MHQCVSVEKCAQAAQLPGGIYSHIYKLAVDVGRQDISEIFDLRSWSIVRSIAYRFSSEHKMRLELKEITIIGLYDHLTVPGMQ